jgi:hypothetical protein
VSDEQWANRLPPPAAVADTVIWRGAPHSLAALSAGRSRLGEVLDTRPRAVVEDSERLLLLFEELGSNGLRHGRLPVSLTVTENGDGWLLEVTDADAAHPPVPAVGRDAARGGLGLHLVARLAAGHGWYTCGGRKHVWACLQRTGPPASA